MSEHAHEAAMSDLKNRARALVNAAERLAQAVTGQGQFNQRAQEPRLNDHLAGKVEVALREAMPEPVEGEEPAPLPIDVDAVVTSLREEHVHGAFDELLQALRDEEATFNDVVARVVATKEEE